MQRPERRITFKGLAFGPVVFSLALCASAAMAQDSGQMETVFRKVSAAEATIVKAIGAGDSRQLSKTGSELGRIIEAALKRREDGGRVTSCDMAAHSLAYLAVSVADGLANKGEPRRLLIEDARAAASDFQKDMSACEKQAGKKTGSHASVERALRAL
ncbi:MULTISPECIES: hypothetical protein [Alphaproteobacteria]|uniref:Uncharacterized protein n=2 Tax=Alphaproteobacteria TaxID=28211 RepID=A0A512HIR3_9HYPH|nr:MULTISPECIES: hypothetical protein [Alphaproteobacteria]GEO85359.1 hypothetical protein RNA01_22910 [Ciceribacter naphthalenivorans]GLR20998.1 hypothetical protein GCM10007920_07830 [Ciceribacter naphthalenivorans]GLT03854.1 hypothetical protein GCM10007926_07830 [Sphingomonas psychrolutea]